jgi:uncharacterized protein (TIGR02588 family)
VRRNLIEWTVLVVSVAGIVLLVGVLVVEGLTEGRPADPVVELRPAEARQGNLGWIIPATVGNAGDESVEAVVLEASAVVGQQREVSELELNFLPAGTTVEVSFAFSRQPAGEVTVRLVGFRLP